MKTPRSIFLILVFAICSAESCPSKCKSNDDCPSGYTCAAGANDDGPGHWCFKGDFATPEDEAAARAGGKRMGWTVDSVQVGASPGGPNVSVTVKRN